MNFNKGRASELVSTKEKYSNLLVNSYNQSQHQQVPSRVATTIGCRAFHGKQHQHVLILH